MFTQKCVDNPISVRSDLPPDLHLTIGAIPKNLQKTCTDAFLPQLCHSYLLVQYLLGAQQGPSRGPNNQVPFTIRSLAPPTSYSFMQIVDVNHRKHTHSRFRNTNLFPSLCNCIIPLTVFLPHGQSCHQITRIALKIPKKA